MNMVIPNEGKTLALDAWLAPDENPGETWHIRLFSNDYTPVNGSTESDFDEAAFAGYGEVDIAQTDWGASAIVAGVAVATSAVAPEYVCSGGSPETCYGWYAVGDSSGMVRAAQRFDVARVFSAGVTERLDPFTISFQTLH